MGKNKIKIQSLIFNKNIFDSKWQVRGWVNNNNFIIDKRLKRPIVIGDNNTYRVRQKNPDLFIKKTFKVKSLGRGVKGVYGSLKR